MNNNQLLTADEVAKVLNVSRPFIYQLADQNKLKSVKLSRRCVRFERSAVDELLAASGGQACDWDKLLDNDETTVGDIARTLDSADVPLKARDIAKRCERKFNTRFQAAITRMKRDGLIVQVGPAHYGKAGRPLPVKQLD